MVQINKTASHTFARLADTFALSLTAEQKDKFIALLAQFMIILVSDEEVPDPGEEHQTSEPPIAATENGDASTTLTMPTTAAMAASEQAVEMTAEIKQEPAEAIPTAPRDEPAPAIETPKIIALPAQSQPVTKKCRECNALIADPGPGYCPACGHECKTCTTVIPKRFEYCLHPECQADKRWLQNHATSNRQGTSHGAIASAAKKRARAAKDRARFDESRASRDPNGRVIVK